MDEKKVELTDEDLINAVKNCLYGDYKTKCKDCPYDNSKGYCQDMDRGLLSLIYRLQYENGRQKAEIERLTELVDKWENAYGDEYWRAKHNEILKEIYLWLQDKDKRGMTVPFDMVLRQLKERYGVEVE